MIGGFVMAYIDRKTFKPYSDISVSEVEQRSFNCDDLIAPVISILNQKGYKTRFCCAGHPYPQYEEMYVVLYEDTYEAISSAWGAFIPSASFFFENAVCKKVSLEDIPKEHLFEDEEIDKSRPYSVFYIETDDKVFGSVAYISFEEKYFTEQDAPFGWELEEDECFDSNEGANHIIQFEFPFNQDVYYFYTQQVAVFMNLYNWAKTLPDISENK